MMMDVNDIKAYLPHRFPFLLVDRITDLVIDKSIVGYKNITANEDVFNGHFPASPIFPGVMIVEALAQVSGVLGFKSMDKSPEGGSIYLLAGVDKVRYRRQVVPGDRLQLESKVVSVKRGIWKFECEASVDAETACSCVIMCADRKV